MEKPNIYQKYEISRSQNGDRIVFLARHGKQKTLVGIADSEAKLVKLMADEAARVEADRLADREAREERAAKKAARKKIPLWKAGGAFRKKDDAAETGTSEEDES